MQFDVIYADPPWRYRNKRSGGSMIHQENRYCTLSFEEISSLPIPELAEKNAALFLWVTNPLLPHGLEVLSIWGFKYKTTLVWHKIMSLGMGFWFRGQTEFLLLGIKGKVPAFRMQKKNIHQCKVGGHSAKPDYFRELIAEASGKSGLGKRIELFAREPTDGWVSVGYEIDGKDIRDALNELILLPEHA